MASLVEKLDQKLTCAICLEQYKEPKVLACLHSYCKGCLQKLVKTVEPEITITCPECRQVTQLPSGDVNAIQTNFFINNLLEVMALDKTTEKKHGKLLTCENCDTNDEAVTRCKVCCVFLCEFCTQSHRRTRATNQHRLMTVEEVKEAGPSALAKPLLCSKHKKETLKLFCHTCDIPVCRDCVLIDHKRHNYAFVEDIFVQQRGEIMACVERAKENMSSIITAVSEIEKVEKFTENNVSKVNEEIDKFIDGLTEAVERKRKSLKEDLKRISQEKTKSFQPLKTDFSIQLASLESIVTFARDVLTNCEKTEILSMRKEIVHGFDQVFWKTRFVPRIKEVNEIRLMTTKDPITNAARLSNCKIPL